MKRQDILRNYGFERKFDRDINKLHISRMCCGCLHENEWMMSVIHALLSHFVVIDPSPPELTNIG